MHNLHLGSVEGYIFILQIFGQRPGWHNWLARETFTKIPLQNLKAEGSSPSSGDAFYFVFADL